MASNTTDFGSQVKEIESQLEAQWQKVQENWQCSAADSLKDGVMKKYFENFKKYETALDEQSQHIEQIEGKMNALLK